jgi:SWI/SNF-related matrix-associated actin-dependent regulator 1 of chromatin subfamily A
VQPFQVSEKGYVRLYVPDGEWADTVRPVLTPKTDGKGKQYLGFDAKRTLYVAYALHKHNADLAKALVRTARQFAEPVDLKALRGDPRLDLCAALDPSAALHPLSKLVISDVERALKVRLPFGLYPRPFQVVGTAFCKVTGYRALIGDAPGVGKTITTISCIATDPERLLPAVVTAPASVLLKWRAEIRKWLPTVPTHVLKDGRSRMPDQGWRGVILCAWSLLEKHADRLADWGVRLFVGDESHYVKEPDAKRSIAAKTLGHAVPHVLLLSGTAMKNRVTELWHQLHIIDPEGWPSKEEFGDAYSNKEEVEVRGQTETKYEGVENVEALRQKLARVMIRRLKKDVAKDLPDKQRVPQPIEINKDDAEEFERLQKDFGTWLKGELERRATAGYEAAGVDPASVSDAIRDEVTERAKSALKNEALVKIGYMRHFLGRAKVAPAVEFCRNLVEQGEPVVVFAEHRDVVSALQAAFTKAKIKHVTIDGSVTNTEKRITAMTKFQNGDYDVFIGTQAAKEGIDLFRSSNVVFVERWWSPADEEQAEDRIHRIGQTRGAVIWYLYVPETIDERMADIIERKRAIFDAALRGEGTVTVTDATVKQELIAELTDPKRKKRTATALQALKEANDETATRPTLPDTKTVHAVMFNASTWTPAAAQRWAKVHGFTARGAMVAGQYVRIEHRGRTEFEPGTFKTVVLGDTMRAIVGTPLPPPKGRKKAS